MHHVEMSVYHVTGSTDEVQQRAQDDLLPLLRQRAGFIDYDLIQGEQLVIATSTWHSREQAEEAGRQSAGWVRENFSALLVRLEEQSVGPAAAAGPPSSAPSAHLPG